MYTNNTHSTYITYNVLKSYTQHQVFYQCCWSCSFQSLQMTFTIDFHISILHMLHAWLKLQRHWWHSSIFKLCFFTNNEQASKLTGIQRAIMSGTPKPLSKQGIIILSCRSTWHVPPEWVTCALALANNSGNCPKWIEKCPPMARLPLPPQCIACH